MKKIFRKAITVLGSAALIGMTAAVASAASYPAPFTSNTAIVVGANAAPSDNIAAASIASNLDANAAGGTTGSVTGESVDLASGSDLLYLNDEFNENVQTLTKDDLPTVLADGTFTNDDGTDYDFEQTLVISAHTDNGFTFTNSDNDLDDPALALELSTSTSNTIYNLTATFNKAVNFSASASEGEDITIFGKTYTVGTATDADTLVLLGGSAGAIINVGESTTISVNGISYDVALLGLSSASTTQASISVNGDTKTFTQGQTKTVGGVDVFVKTVFRTGDDGNGYAEVQIGADKLTLEDGNAVQVGSDNDDIDGTLVSFSPSSNPVGALTKLTISVAAEDNDVNHLLVGESFVDPVFGTVLLRFEGVDNGPVFSGEKDIGRTELEIRKGGNREMQVVVTDNAGNTATLPLSYNDALSDDSGNTISVVEGEAISDDGYFILNSGNNYHFMQMTKVNIVVATPANSDVAMKDLLSGTTYTFDNHDFTSGYAATIAGQTYTITNTSTTAVTVTSSDYGKGATGKIAVYPYLELVSGEDTRVAWTDNVAITGVTVGAVLQTPTGDITLASNTTVDTESPGEVDYVVGVTAASATTANLTIALDVDQDGTSDNAQTNVSLLFVEDDDKSESTATTKNAVILTVDDDGTYATCLAPVFPQQTEDTGYNSETWDDTDLTGWLTNYGTYVWRDTGDSNQNFVGLSYGDDMMSADVIFAEGEAATAPDAGVMTVDDVDVGTVAGKNLIVVGGSAINSVAAELLGAAYREAAFTTATGVAAGEFLIQSFSRAGKTALLVAGYNAADTEKAVTYLLNNAVTTTTGTKYKGTSATEASLVVV